ncbi:putative cytosolic protein [Granulibacter bethesdensis]|uniref:Cytosolic protein n=2 Tax=Granulibacter bethesdensis TaxID=364410 RepID=Q0BQ12_GRABC|nr:putative cytosolic protein [Granulibacter bethesdensis CGDNIH1]AHJ67940.1 putative cytosolic protein [Granulibacter bethesdensis]APH52966.1 putative cytosolic protein [Granulibacter bethesdensis]APH65654.1 putative cytosolic protein [Granulibacter bethesdensis]
MHPFRTRPEMSTAPTLLHIISPEDWQNALKEGCYAPPGLEREGFIHLCTPEQLSFVLRLHYPDQDGLLLLSLSADDLSALLRWEVSEPDQPPFPHLYGALRTDHVLSIRPVTPQDRV